MCAFLNVSRPFQANWGWRGHQATVSHYDRDVTKPLSMGYPSWKNISKTFEISAFIVRMIIRRLGLQQQHIGRRINS
jgi:hypothetical protein